MDWLREWQAKRATLAGSVAALVVLLCVSFATAQTTPSDPIPGADPPADFDPSEAPGATPESQAEIKRVTDEAERKEQERREQLASPAAVAERRESENKFVGISDG